MRPNILLITADDMNYNSVGAYGCQIGNITPNIDRLAAEGMRFENAYVTVAICQPSRQCMMTGRYPHNNGAPSFHDIREDVPTLQEKLREQGYINGILGKEAHLQPMHKYCWDYCIRLETDTRNYGRDYTHYYDKAAEFFHKVRDRNAPFFLMVNSHAPHRPFANSEDERKTFHKNIPVRRVITEEEAEVPGFLPDIPMVRKEAAQYFTSVHCADEIVGAALRALEEAGLEENTLVIFLSDNGMAFPFGKVNCYVNSNKTPWIVRWPGKIKPGTVDCSHFISGIDFMNTILEAADAGQDEQADGTSFLPLLRGEEQPWRKDVFTLINATALNIEYPMRAVVNGRYIYIYNFWSDGTAFFRAESKQGLTYKAMVEASKEDPMIAQRVKLFDYRVREELYDIVKDPEALENLAEDAGHSEALENMRGRLKEYMIRSKDPLAERII